MELKEFTNEFIKLLNISEISELPEALMKTLRNEKELKKFIKSYDKLIKDDNTDFLQGLYEFWLSDREELSQDYTPQSLAKLVGMLSNHENEKVIYDMCCGMGSLTLAKLQSHGNCKYILKELDTTVLPFLLFKLCYNNVNAKVYTEDVLLGNRKAEYTVRNGILVNELPIAEVKVDTVISNPPFNLKLETPVKTKEFIFDKLLNYAFIFKALECLNDDGAGVFILPNGILSSTEELKYRKYLIEHDLVDVVISVPGKMFTNTDIPTTVLKVRKSKPDNRKGKITFIKSQPTGLYKRKQKGEDHMKTRVYTKNFLFYTDEDLLEIAEAISKQTNQAEFCNTVTVDDVIDKDYDLAPSKHVVFDFKKDSKKHRSFKDIIADIKRCDTRRGLVKLTINQTLAEQFDIETVNMDVSQQEAIFDNLRQLLKTNPDKMEDLTLEDLNYEPLRYMTLSKKKNELKFEQNSKDFPLSEMFIMMMQLWIQNVLMWNNEETRYLKELLDKMLPLLMSGELDVSEVDTYE